MMLRVLLFLCVLFLSACSSGSGESTGSDHVWKSQTDALQKARETEQLLADEVARKKRNIEQQSQ